MGGQTQCRHVTAQALTRPLLQLGLGQIVGWRVNDAGSALPVFGFDKRSGRLETVHEWNSRLAVCIFFAVRLL